MSRKKLVGGLALMLLGTFTFAASAIGFYDLLSPGDAGWADRLRDAATWLAYGAMTTWCAVMASGEVS